ncbi:MAG: hypothetical protein RMJ36_05515 [Candidatus Calescibacterium sp.]|nr:hypothetical protein [Candidatus Calescibacterium sp.]MDW8133094.1 hypothetical protein [Candidatus Calescibacterium sp.]
MLRIIALILIVISISVVPLLANKDNKEDKTSKSKCCSTCVSSSKKVVEMKKTFLSNVVFEELLSGKTINVDLSSSKSVMVFVDKQSLRDYNQVNNFTKWLEQKKLDIKVYTLLNGQDKNELKVLAKSNNIVSALWGPSLVTQMKVEKYPVAYYIVNGVVVDKTDKLSVGNLKHMVWCEKCENVRKERCCEDDKNSVKNSKSVESSKKVKDEKNEIKKSESKDRCTKEGCCGGNCKCGANCKC